MRARQNAVGTAEDVPQEAGGTSWRTSHSTDSRANGLLVLGHDSGI